MTSTISGREDGLGGRLPLLLPSELDDDQRSVYDALNALVVPEAAESGFTARLDDGRFIGPFNSMLRVPALSKGFGQWTGAIAHSGMSEEVRQVIILTVGAFWDAAFELDAHVAAAKASGVSDAAVEAIVKRRRPVELSEAGLIAHRYTRALLEEHRVVTELYAAALGHFGENGLIAILSLIGQYQMISSILVSFEVPVPGRSGMGSVGGEA